MQVKKNSLVDKKLHMTQQCVFAAQKDNCVLGCIPSNASSRTREVILSFYFALVRPHMQFWVLSIRRTWTCGASPEIRQIQRLEGWSTSPEKKS